MKDRRSYVMRARASSVGETRLRILSAVRDLGMENMTLEIVLADVADRADVSVRTVLRHFGSRDGLFEATMTFVGEQLLLDRGTPPVGDVRAAITTLYDEYERGGDFMITMLGQENTVPNVRRMTENGRVLHRDWVRSVFGPLVPPGRSPDEVIDLLVVATDVYTWKLLRRDRGLDRADTERRVHLLVTAVLSGPTAPDEG